VLSTTNSAPVGVTAIAETVSRPLCIVVDDTDPVAGPQLIVSERASGRLRAISLRTQTVSTIAGVAGFRSQIDGPALRRAHFAPLVAGPSSLPETPDLPAIVRVKP
jgi:hypothetical protein